MQYSILIRCCPLEPVLLNDGESEEVYVHEILITFMISTFLMFLSASNSGYDPMDCLVKLREEFKASVGTPVGLDIATGEALNPIDAGIFDNYCVKKHMLDAW